nr:uncharacterized protein LOC109163447 isoform X1 [Ipomoea batatas]
MDAAEESGWTDYLQDFSVGNQRDNNGGDYYHDDDEDDDSFNGGASLLSDAASHPAWKHINKNPSSSPCPYSSLPASQALNRLNFKKAVIRPNTKLSDPDLEDTASSPVNSPKVSSLKQMENNYRRQEINSGNYMGKGADFEDYSEMQGEGRRSINFAAKSEEDNIDLMKKRGLCVMSLFMNYSNNNNNNN